MTIYACVREREYGRRALKPTLDLRCNCLAVRLERRQEGREFQLGIHIKLRHVFTQFLRSGESLQAREAGRRPSQSKVKPRRSHVIALGYLSLQNDTDKVKLKLE